MNGECITKAIVGDVGHVVMLWVGYSIDNRNKFCDYNLQPKLAIRILL
jgi:hypothetical protein